MSTGFWSGRSSRVAVMLAGAIWFAPAVTPAAAQTPAASQVQSDPIKCWWRTEQTAIHVGERFSLVLTCGVIDTPTVRVEPDPTKLDAGAIALVPFEVLSGTRSQDIQAPPWRYFQYTYTVRLVGDEFFGKDASIPSTQITYRINTTTGSTTNSTEQNANEAEGVEQLYVLPAIPIRVLSLVPASAKDIRDPSPGTFADIEVHGFRAQAAFIVSTILFVFAGLLAVLAVARILGRYRRQLPASARLLPSRSVLRGCLDAADALKADVGREGWTPELAQRALVLLRIAGAVALDRPVSQTLVNGAVQEREGELIVRSGRLRPKRTVVSARTTASAIASELSNGNGRVAGTDAVLEEIQESLRVFSAARYGRDGRFERDALDTAFQQAANAMQRLYTIKRPTGVPGILKGAAAGATAWSR